MLFFNVFQNLLHRFLTLTETNRWLWVLRYSKWSRKKKQEKTKQRKQKQTTLMTRSRGKLHKKFRSRGEFRFEIFYFVLLIVTTITAEGQIQSYVFFLLRVILLYTLLFDYTAMICLASINHSLLVLVVHSASDCCQMFC